MYKCRSNPQHCDLIIANIYMKKEVTTTQLVIHKTFFIEILRQQIHKLRHTESNFVMAIANKFHWLSAQIENNGVAAHN